MQAPAYAENQVAATPPSRIHLPYQHIPAWLALVLSDGYRPPTCRLGHRHDPNRATQRLLHGKHPLGWCRLTSFGPAVVSPAILRAHTVPITR